VDPPTVESSFDTQGWPLYRMVVGPQPDITEVEAVLADYTRAIASGVRCCLLVDASATTRLDLVHVKAIAKFSADQHDALAASVRV
jgi:hypothetical protein